MHASSAGSGEFDRTPPQDVVAEQCVLGGMMLSADAIADVVEVLRSADFYRPAHQLIYDAVLDLYGRGEPVDAVTVSAELTKRGEAGRVGGSSYLHTLLSSVPTAANAGYYARIVGDRAVLRRLVEAGTRIAQMGYGSDGEVDDIVDAAQAEIYAVTERRAAEDYLPLAQIMEGTLDEIESIGNSGGGITGVHRVRRPRRADQRPARRADGDRGRQAGHGKVHPRARLRAVRLDSPRAHRGDLLPRDGPQRDHHAVALGRGQGLVAEHPLGQAVRRRLDTVGPADG